MVGAPCSYDRHRTSDHVRGDGTGSLTCGICHPPCYDCEAVRRGDPRFDELVAAAAAREQSGPWCRKCWRHVAVGPLARQCRCEKPKVR